jgi:glyoxylase-like metal-dependent hydrolase (beta-lactamase superfamily II)
MKHDERTCAGGGETSPRAAAAPIRGNGWSVEPLGRDVFLFRWERGFYLSVFFVAPEGVLATDPVSAETAVAYREAISRVTDRPVTRVLYSHDHRDHIVGAAALGDDLEVIAHPRAETRIRERGHVDIVPPGALVGDGAVIEHGAHRIEVNYFGPNHSGSNLIFTFDTGRGRMLTWVDGVEPGIAPYRNLPDTDFGGYLHSLEQAARLRFDAVIGGHAGPGEPRWVTDYHEYLQRLVEATDAAYQSMGGQAPLPGEDGIAMTERVRHEAGVRAAEALRARFGHWAGFDPWAPQTADRILSFLITGN